MSKFTPYYYSQSLHSCRDVGQASVTSPSLSEHADYVWQCMWLQCHVWFSPLHELSQMFPHWECVACIPWMFPSTSPSLKQWSVEVNDVSPKAYSNKQNASASYGGVQPHSVLSVHIQSKWKMNACVFLSECASACIVYVPSPFLTTFLYDVFSLMFPVGVWGFAWITMIALGFYQGH